MAKTSTKPSGLKITRSGNKMICQWTTHSYESQTFEINVNNAKKNKKLVWHAMSVGASTHSKTILCDGTVKYNSKSNAKIPRVTTGFRFRVKGKSKKKSASGFKDANYAAKKLGTPTKNRPGLWNNTSDTYLYTWSQHASDGDRSSSTKMFERFYWETVIMPKDTAVDWTKVGEQKITLIDPTTLVIKPNQNSSGTSTAASPQIIIVESAADIEANKVRYFRMRSLSRASAYHSGFQSHIVPLGAPASITLNNATATFGSSDSRGTTATVSFADMDTKTDPNMQDITTEIQYAITAPYVVTETGGVQHYSKTTDASAIDGKDYYILEDGSYTLVVDRYKLSEDTEVVSGKTYYEYDDETETYSIVEPDGTEDPSDEGWFIELSPSAEGWYELYISTDVVHSTLRLPDNFNSFSTDLNGKFTGTQLPDVYTFRTTDVVTNNTCLFLRVVRTHDGRTSYGPALLVSKPQTSFYQLSDPVLGAVQVDTDRKEITVTVTNTSELASGGNKSFVAVYLRTDSVPNPDKPIGLIPYTSSSAVSATFPAQWTDDEEATLSVGIRSFVADYSPSSRAASGVTEYTISDILMASSGIIWEENSVPQPPQNIHVTRHGIGIAQITWDWNWAQADGVEISWSKDKIIWQSTEEPSTYIVSGTRVGERYVTGLDADTYFFRLRFIRNVGDVVTYGTYSDFKELSMSAAPDIPVLQLVPEGTAALDDEITAYWRFSTNDGTTQSYAELTEAWKDGNSWTYADPEKWLKIDTAEKKSFTPREMGWEENSQHYICVRVTSQSLKTSEGWSNPKPINVAAKPTIEVSGIGDLDNSLRSKTVTLDDGSEYTYPLALYSLPICCSVTGTDSGGYVTATITRSENFEIVRPDDSSDQGYDDEVVFTGDFSLSTEEVGNTVNIEINTDDLEGSLDDTASYILALSVTDSYGQSTEPVEYPFTVLWERQAEKPTAIIDLIEEQDIAIIEPIAPSTATASDHYEIYRLSADRPVLIKANAIAGEQYVDEYPTFGQFGGYRIVHVTEFGDYTTADRDFAWVDYGPDEEDEFYLRAYDKFAVAIEFGGEKVEFIGNVSVSNNWTKDFQQTVYLGGSVEGDWNPDVVRSGSINSTMPVDYDPDAVYKMRLLADYAGVCHVRTPEGSNFYADVQGKDNREEKWVTKIAKVSLDYTAVDNISDDIPTYDNWETTQDED